MSEARGLGEAYLQPRNERISIGEVCGGWSIRASQEKSDKAVSVWQTLKLSVTPKFHASKYHACDRGLADFCEDSVEQRHQVGLKNNWRTTSRGSGIGTGSANCTPNGSSEVEIVMCRGSRWN